MPYIVHDDRIHIDSLLGPLITEMERNSAWFKRDGIGRLNYVITRVILATQPDRYRDYNELLGLLEAVKLELYRRRVAPYENLKAVATGDVY